MSIALSKMAITAAIVGLGSAVSSLGGHEKEDAPRPPVVQHASKGSDMCAIAASFSANPVMADEIRRAAGCVQQASASR